MGISANEVERDAYAKAMQKAMNDGLEAKSIYEKAKKSPVLSQFQPLKTAAENIAEALYFGEKNNFSPSGAASLLDEATQLVMQVHALEELMPIQEALEDYLASQLVLPESDGNSRSSSPAPSDSSAASSAATGTSKVVKDYIKEVSRQAIASLSPSHLQKMVESYREIKQQSNSDKKSTTSSDSAKSAEQSKSPPVSKQGSSRTGSTLSDQSLNSIIESTGLNIDKFAALAGNAAQSMHLSGVRSDGDLTESVKDVFSAVMPSPYTPVETLISDRYIGTVARKLLRELSKSDPSAENPLSDKFKQSVLEDALYSDMDDFKNHALGYDEPLLNRYKTPESKVFVDLVRQSVAERASNLFNEGVSQAAIRPEGHVDEIAFELLRGNEPQALDFDKGQIESFYNELRFAVHNEYSDKQILDAMKQSVRQFIKFACVSNNCPVKPRLKNEFLVHVLLCLKQGPNPGLASIEKFEVKFEVSELIKNNVLKEDGGFRSANASRSVNHLLLNPVKQIAGSELHTTRQHLMPTINSSSFFGLRSGEKFRLQTLKWVMGGANQPLINKIVGAKPRTLTLEDGLKNLAKDIEVTRVKLKSRPEDKDDLILYKLKKPEKQQILLDQAQDLINAVSARDKGEEQLKVLNSLYKAQVVNSGIDTHFYDQVVTDAYDCSNNASTFKNHIAGGLYLRNDETLGVKLDIDRKVLDRWGDKNSGKSLSNLGEHGGAVKGNDNRAYVFYKAQQQALWNCLLDEVLKQDPVTKTWNLDVPALGFDKPGATNADLIQAGKLVMAAVTPATARGYAAGLIDYMNHLNRNPEEPATGVDLQKMGNYLGRMLENACIINGLALLPPKPPAALASASASASAPGGASAPGASAPGASASAASAPAAATPQPDGRQAQVLMAVLGEIQTKAMEIDEKLQLARNAKNEFGNIKNSFNTLVAELEFQKTELDERQKKIDDLKNEYAALIARRSDVSTSQNLTSLGTAIHAKSEELGEAEAAFNISKRNADFKKEQFNRLIVGLKDSENQANKTRADADKEIRKLNPLIAKCQSEASKSFGFSDAWIYAWLSPTLSSEELTNEFTEFVAAHPSSGSSSALLVEKITRLKEEFSNPNKRLAKETVDLMKEMVGPFFKWNRSQMFGGVLTKLDARIKQGVSPANNLCWLRSAWGAAVLSMNKESFVEKVSTLVESTAVPSSKKFSREEIAKLYDDISKSINTAPIIRLLKSDDELVNKQKELLIAIVKSDPALLTKDVKNTIKEIEQGGNPQAEGEFAHAFLTALGLPVIIHSRDATVPDLYLPSSFNANEHGHPDTWPTLYHHGNHKSGHWEFYKPLSMR